MGYESIFNMVINEFGLLYKCIDYVHIELLLQRRISRLIKNINKKGASGR
jgi:hypothetical protein